MYNCEVMFKDFVDSKCVNVNIKMCLMMGILFVKDRCMSDILI